MNGGHGERALWNRSRDELEIIRTFTWLHTEMQPYIYSIVVTAHRGAKPLIRPVKGKYQYMFGDAFLVAPIFQDTTYRSMILPGGQWRYFFDDKEMITGPKRLERDFPLSEYPVYVRNGSIIPLNVQRRYTDLGDESSKDFTTLLIYPHETSEFTLFHPYEGATTIRVEDTKTFIEISISGVKIPHILRFHLEKPPDAVYRDGDLLRYPEEWNFDKRCNKLIIKTADYIRGQYKIVMSDQY